MCISVIMSVSVCGGRRTVGQYHHTGSQISAVGLRDSALSSMLSMAWERMTVTECSMGESKGLFMPSGTTSIFGFLFPVSIHIPGNLTERTALTL